MPPYATDAIRWQYTARSIEVVPDGPKYKVQVRFTRVGQRMDTQERVEETFGTYEFGSKLGPQQASSLRETLSEALDTAYIQGHSDARRWN